MNEIKVFEFMRTNMPQAYEHYFSNYSRINDINVLYQTSDANYIDLDYQIYDGVYNYHDK